MTRSLPWLWCCLLAAAIAGGQEERRGEGREGEGREEGRGGPGDFLRRMDANGNGAIDPEEAQGRAGFFLRRIAENSPDINLTKPIPLDKLEQAAAAARERWEVNNGGERREERLTPSANGEAPRDGERSSPGKSPARLVPGFGEAAAAADVPGFGLLAKAVAVLKVTDADRAEAQRRFGNYDRNNDGVLDGDEMAQGRARDYGQYDSNGDGQLTVDELAVRYARRRVEEQAAAKAAAAASSGSSNSARRDDDDDRSRRDESASRTSASNSRSNSKSAPAKLYRVADAEERLAKKGLPSWFLDKDADNDGQVAMAEYGESWSDSTIAEFAKFDLDGDGVITPDECLRAAKTGGSSSRGSIASSRSSGASRTEVAKADPPRNDPPEPATKAIAPDASQAQSQVSDEARDATETTSTADASNDSAASQISADATKPAEPPIEVDARYLSYAQGRIQQVDADGDGVLQPGEWINMSKSPAAADVDGDQRITAYELAIYLMKK